MIQGILLFLVCLFVVNFFIGWRIWSSWKAGIQQGLIATMSCGIFLFLMEQIKI